jgi:hypothetical protein
MGKIGFDLALTSQVLELINGVLFVICLWMAVTVASYLCRERRKYGGGFIAMARSGNYGLPASLFFFSAGATVIHATVWYVRHLINHGQMVVPVKDDTTLTAIISSGTVLCCLAGILTIRAMMPDRYGQWPWIIMTVTAIVFGVSGAWIF